MSAKSDGSVEYTDYHSAAGWDHCLSKCPEYELFDRLLYFKL